jgi:hypothetical protein
MWAGTAAILNQRPVCDHSMFWDLHLLTGGTLEMETDDGAGDYTVLTTAGILPVNDGNQHQVSVQRVGGMLTISIDGASTPPVASLANFAGLVALRQGTNVCVGETANVVSFSNVCVASP